MGLGMIMESCRQSCWQVRAGAPKKLRFFDLDVRERFVEIYALIVLPARFKEINRFRFRARLKRIAFALPLGEVLEEIISVGGAVEEAISSAALEIMTIPIVVSANQFRFGGIVQLPVDDLFLASWFHSDLFSATVWL